MALRSIVLFAVPRTLLGVVSPYAIRLEARTLAGMGNTAGMLYSLSTAGSIVGTFATAFVLVPAMGVRNIIYLLGALLLLLAAAGYASGARRMRARALLLTVMALPIALTTILPDASFARQPVRVGPAGEAILLEKDTLYHHLVVGEQRGVRYLRFDDSVQGAMYVDQPEETPVVYVPRMALGLVLQPEPEHALLIGLGPGSLPKLLVKALPDLQLDVAEIDPEVVKVAQNYFYLPKEDRLRIHTADGRDFLESSRQNYDLVFLDAYYASYIPFHLTTREFLGELKGKMTSGGVVVANIVGTVTGDRSRLFRAMYKTFREVFPEVYVFDEPEREPSAARNLILVASKTVRRSKVFSAQTFPQSLENGLGWVTHADLARYAAGLYTGAIPVQDVPVLTDDYAPLDSLLDLL